jgi:hypothetical protein
MDYHLLDLFHGEGFFRAFNGSDYKLFVGSREMSPVPNHMKRYPLMVLGEESQGFPVFVFFLTLFFGEADRGKAAMNAPIRMGGHSWALIQSPQEIHGLERLSEFLL